MGRLLAVFFLWVSDDEKIGRAYLQEIESFGTVLLNQVVVTTVAEVCFRIHQIGFRFKPEF
jgi:hypothetical protein